MLGLDISIRKSNIRFILLILFYLIYVVIGAAIVSAVEGPIEKAIVKKIRKHRANMMAKTGNCLSGKGTSFVNIPMIISKACRDHLRIL
jgi:hypothetical protein